MKVKLGPMVGQASGGIGGMVASHNRYGTYFRRRAIPITATSELAILAKANMSSISQAWSDLAADVRLAWATWAANNPIIDRLGDKQVLTGHAAYVKLNARNKYFGFAEIASPPVSNAPDALTGMSITGDIGAGNVAVVYAPTPNTAKILVWGAVTGSASQAYVANKLRLLNYIGIGDNSPKDIEGWVEGRFGALQVGQNLHIECQTWDTATGLVSRPVSDSVLITST